LPVETAAPIPLDRRDVIDAQAHIRSRRATALAPQWIRTMMQSTLQRLARRGVPVAEYPQSSANLTAISQNLYELGHRPEFRIAASGYAITR
jgi:hypothetical protein